MFTRTAINLWHHCPRPQIERSRLLLSRSYLPMYPVFVRTRKCYTSVCIKHSARIEERLLSEQLSSKEIRDLKGRLTFTSTDSLKLVMPLPDKSNTVAFLLHAQQPLSYLESLIREEISSTDSDCKITFWDVHKHSKWSTGIQMSDFIREGAATRKFCITITDQTATSEIDVNVPSFEDRTIFLRTQLGRLTDTSKLRSKYIMVHSD